MIEFDCPKCGHNFSMKDASAGRKGKCKQCGAKLSVPPLPPPTNLPLPHGQGMIPMEFDEPNPPTVQQNRPTPIAPPTPVTTQGEPEPESFIICDDTGISEMDRQLRDTPLVSLVIAIERNRRKRNACVFFGLIALLIILLFDWSKWLLVIPAVLGIGAFLYQMNIVIVSSELKRRRTQPPTKARDDGELDEKELDEAKRRLEFMNNHKDTIAVHITQYLEQHPDDSLTDDVINYVCEKCFLEHEIAAMEGKISQAKQQVEEEEEVIAQVCKDEKPFGNVTYEQASQYFHDYCAVLKTAVAFAEPESRLPTTVERMAEALKVECLHWCQCGDDFHEACNFMAMGIFHLSRFVPDHLAGASARRMTDLVESGDLPEYEAAELKKKMAREWQERTRQKLNLEWSAFVKQYKDKYSK